MSNNVLSRAKATATSALSFAAHPRIARLFHNGPLTILMYHGIVERDPVIPDPCMVRLSEFRAQMRILKKHFSVMSAEDAVARLRSGEIERPTAVVTFDDGYQNNFDLAYPVMAEEEIPATIFLATKYMNSNGTIWTGHLHSAFMDSSENSFSWENHLFDMSSIAARTKSLIAIKSILKRRPQAGIMKSVTSILELLGIDPAIGVDRQSPYRMLDTVSLEALARSPLISLGAHTHSHYILSGLDERDQEKEIHKSLRFVEDLTGAPCRVFAYPNGTREDYDQRTMSVLYRHGVNIAMTTESGVCRSSTPSLELQRIAVGSNTSLAAFRLSLFDIPNRLKKAVRVSR